MSLVVLELVAVLEIQTSSPRSGNFSSFHLPSLRLLLGGTSTNDVPLLINGQCEI
jgi:hypothetical protein